MGEYNVGGNYATILRLPSVFRRYPPGIYCGSAVCVRVYPCRCFLWISPPPPETSTMSAAADNPHPHIDPSLVALAAQVQAHANAQAQRHVSISTPHRHIPPATTDNHLGLGLPSEALGPALQIDPSLFEIEQVVNDVRRGKIRLGEDRRDEQELERPIQHPNDTAHHSQHQHQQQQQADHPGEHGGLEGHGGLGDTSDGLQMDDEIDPTLREIVNSLTNAQQVC